MLQDPTLELDQPRSGLEAVLDQLSAPIVEDRERICLSADAVEGFHQALASMFAIGMFCEQRPEVSDRFVRSPAGESVRGSALPGAEPQLFEPSGRNLCEVAVGELAQGRTSPEPYGVIDAAFGKQVLEDVGVETALADMQAVPHVIGYKVTGFGAQAAPEPRDLRPQRGRRLSWKAVAPQAIDKRAGFYRPAGLQEQH